MHGKRLVLFLHLIYSTLDMARRATPAYLNVYGTPPEHVYRARVQSAALAMLHSILIYDPGPNRAATSAAPATATSTAAATMSAAAIVVAAAATAATAAAAAATAATITIRG